MCRCLLIILTIPYVFLLYFKMYWEGKFLTTNSTFIFYNKFYVDRLNWKEVYNLFCYFVHGLFLEWNVQWQGCWTVHRRYGTNSITYLKWKSHYLYLWTPKGNMQGQKVRPTKTPTQCLRFNHNRLLKTFNRRLFHGLPVRTSSFSPLTELKHKSSLSKKTGLISFRT